MHDDLLILAEELANREEGRPKQTSLRRSVSTAYYAVFHALAFLCADALIGWRQPWDAFTPIYRALDHGTARRVFDADRDGQLFGSDVAELGRIFVLLQEARHKADYNPEPFAYGRKETLEFVERAKRAVDTVKSLRTTQTRKRVLAANLIGKKR